MEQVLAWLNDPMHKTVVGFVGMFLLTRWPAFVKKAVPMVLTACSLIVTALGAAFGDLNAAAPAVYAAAGLGPAYDAWNAAAGSGVQSFLFNWLVPVAMAVGVHSYPKNLLQWFRLGAPIIEKNLAGAGKR